MDVTLAAALAVVFVAGGIQRITGMGFALCATPILVVLYGATEGVRLVVVLAGAASVVMLIGMWRLVEWRRAWSLIWPGLLVSPLGALLAFALPEPALLLLVAGAAMLTLLAGRIRPLALLTSGPGATIKTGAAAGLLNITSGLSGPPLVSHATESRWSHRSFVASVQLVFIALDLVTVMWRGFPSSPLTASGLLLLSALLGLAAGSVAARRLGTRTARAAMYAIAWLGVLAVLVRGVLALVEA